LAKKKDFLPGWSGEDFEKKKKKRKIFEQRSGHSRNEMGP